MNYWFHYLWGCRYILKDYSAAEHEVVNFAFLCLGDLEFS